MRAVACCAIGAPAEPTSPILEKEIVSHTFLSDDWFTAMDALRAEVGDPEVAPAMKDLKLNIVVTGGPEGDREVHLDAGQFRPGAVDGAPTKLIVPFDVARSIFIDGNQQAAMQAFMTGKVRVEGDISRVMAMQTAGTSPSQQAFQDRLKAITAT